MPVVHKNVLKAARQSEKRRLRNRSVESGVKGIIKKLQAALEEKKTDEVKAALLEATRSLAKAASKGIIHRNTASRKIARLTAQARKTATA
ncbi:MAG: 30S ribosomal protein S20 [Nitrospirae bacterium]|nr:MAG: 30S ribosomal protein S20 [Nitrospirota bacterium]